MSDIVQLPLFGIFLSIAAFELGRFLSRKIKHSLANPLVIAICIIIAFLKIFDIPYEYYNNGANFIGMFMVPATASLALSIYRNLEVLKKNLLPVAVGTAVGSLTSIVSVIVLCRVFRLDETLTVSLFSKSVTSAIAMQITEQAGGMVPITIAAVVVTGIFGALSAPLFIKLFKIDDPIAVGASIGTSSHALGTTKALEIGEVEGAISGLSIATAGFFTVIYSFFLL